jgi:pimeloyl-ACP methyl ester carboxylesterase
MTLCRTQRWRLVAATVLGAVVLTPLDAAQARAKDSAVSCQDVTVPVSLVVGQSADNTVYGRLCQPAGTETRTLQVLLHGVTYDHHYWDMPGFNGRYSYVDYMAGAGYATLALDRIGSGLSSHPAGSQITATSNADVVHQVIQAVRGGQVGGRAWSKVITVGHSYGTVVAEQEAAAYRDVNGLVGTGWQFPPGQNATDGLVSRLYPAGMDPKFPGLASDTDYLTTVPDTRSYFYQEGNYDPAVLAEDESLKQTATTAEFNTVMVPAQTAEANPISARSLLVVGEHDVFSCSAPDNETCTPQQVIASQAKYFASQAQLAAHVQPGAGHDLALELNNTDGFDAIAAWLQANFPA